MVAAAAQFRFTRKLLTRAPAVLLHDDGLPLHEPIPIPMAGLAPAAIRRRRRARSAQRFHGGGGPCVALAAAPRWQWCGRWSCSNSGVQLGASLMQLLWLFLKNWFIGADEGEGVTGS